MKETFAPHVGSRRTSPYADEFFQGATIVPRSFWFVVPVPHPTFGIDPASPSLKSDPDLEQKKPWIGVKLEGNAESQFLFGTLLSADVVPFTPLALRPVVLPVRRGEKLELIDSAANALKLGFSKLANWLSQTEKYWEERATVKSKESGLYKWLNYRSKITNQNPGAKFKVLYTASASDLTACVVDLTGPLSTAFGGHTIPLTSFVVESKTYCFDTDNENEAYYLSAILNSEYANEAIKESQTKGLFGPRDIHKRPLNVPFPRYAKTNPDHKRLSELGRLCTERAKALIPTTAAFKSLAKKRATIRKAVATELAEIDSIIQRLVAPKQATSLAAAA